MTGVYIEYSSFSMKALHDFVFKLTGKKAKLYPSVYPMYSLVFIEVLDDGVYLFQGREEEEGTVIISLPEALTYIREQVFIQSLEN